MKENVEKELSCIKYKGRTYKIAVYGLISDSYKFDKNVNSSPPEEDEVQICIDWIQKFTKPRKTVNYRYSSYYLKHKVEKWAGHYISNGAFIEAVHRIGGDVIPVGPNNSNAFFRLSYNFYENLEYWQ